MRKLIVLLFWLSAGAGCHKDIDPDCTEKLIEGVVCPAIADPVCGCNGKTYSSACVAEAYSIKRYTKGACQ